MRLKIAAVALTLVAVASGRPASAQDIFEVDRWHGGSWGHMASDGWFMLFGFALLIVVALVLGRYFDAQLGGRFAGGPYDAVATRCARRAFCQRRDRRSRIRVAAKSAFRHCPLTPRRHVTTGREDPGSAGPINSSDLGRIATSGPSSNRDGYRCSLGRPDPPTAQS